jgi:alpha,alpha-trehalase
MSESVWKGPEVDAIERYVEGYWERITRHTPETREQTTRDEDGTATGSMTLLGLPNPYVIPAEGVFEAQFYWDSYFTMTGLIAHGHVDLARGMVENFLHLQREYGMIPNASATLWLHNNSQSPFLTAMIRLVFDETGDRAWLADAMDTAMDEYRKYWMDEGGHLVFQGLNRFHSKDGTIFWSEAEAWDFTPRFGDVRSCVAIDLNALLYRYEMDFAWFCELSGREPEAARWQEAASRRRAAVDQFLWSADDGLYYDYDYVAGERRPVKSLAAYYPLWAGMASQEQAERLRDNLALFEYDWGVATCDRNYAELPSLLEYEGAILPNERKQWNWPNGWPPLHWLVVTGLARYGFGDDARRIAGKYARCVIRNHSETGRIWEKYNVVEGNTNCAGRYPLASGFGWTNAVFVAFRALYGGDG